MAEPRAFPRFSIRPPQAADLRTIERAERTCFPDPWPGHYFASELFAPGRFHRLVVDAAGELVAYLFAAWQYLDLHVLKVATLPPYRRMGLATELLALAERHALETGGDAVTLEVRTSNLAAIAMYEGLGYHRAGLRRGYYHDGEDALVMTKDLER
ncbi:MAG TPA: ribosomal protein S18-alanine N-acetyltransferase [Thermoanaerobaculales bacterium]|nr:ribosomal protein S18-alanine N-acetyltransferase [Thermoanaerobaculales bacterium]HQN94944.1 ribosomal protein S18-alanine N-acetyltransferase [Thermoanaerobaculales bacterium]HQP43155.1 ribosomal protein S18-alanine N-acetyltransferase [Thermoanaerobaculales bacterium]